MTGPTMDQEEERLSRSVIDALSRSEPLRARDLGSLRVVSRGSRVVLQGLVASEAHEYAAIRIAQGVPGVGEVVDELVTDQDLERRVGVALASDDGTRHFHVVVRVSQGTATLYGAVPSQDAAAKVQAVALAAATQLSGAVSKLHVVAPGTPVVLAWQNSIEGRPLPVPTPSAAAGNVPTESEREQPKVPPMAAGMEGAA